MCFKWIRVGNALNLKGNDNGLNTATNFLIVGNALNLKGNDN